MISRSFCEHHGIKIKPLSKLVGCDAVNGTEIEYGGFVELNFQVLGRNFSEDHKVPVTVGTYVLDRYKEYLKDIGPHVLLTLDTS